MLICGTMEDLGRNDECVNFVLQNNVRPVLADVTPLTQDAAKTTTKTTSKEPQKVMSKPFWAT